LISQNNDFATPLSIKIRKLIRTDYEREGIMMFSAVPYLVNDISLSNPLDKGFVYLNNHICAYSAVNFI